MAITMERVTQTGRELTSPGAAGEAAAISSCFSRRD